jgi:chaperonin cofactor prefoldin
MCETASVERMSLRQTKNRKMKIETTEKIETLEDELQTLDSCAESDIARINEIKQEIAQLCADSASEE